MINLKVLSTAAAMALLLPMVAPSLSAAQAQEGRRWWWRRCQGRRWRRRSYWRWRWRWLQGGGGGGSVAPGGGGGFRGGGMAVAPGGGGGFRGGGVAVAPGGGAASGLARRHGVGEGRVAGGVYQGGGGGYYGGGYRHHHRGGGFWPGVAVGAVSASGRPTAITAVPPTTITRTDITTRAWSQRLPRPTMMPWRTARRGTDPTIRRREPISAMTGCGIPARRSSTIVMNSKGGAFRCAALFVANYARSASATPPSVTTSAPSSRSPSGSCKTAAAASTATTGTSKVPIEAVVAGSLSSAANQHTVHRQNWISVI